MSSQKDIAAESGAPMLLEQRRELMLRQLRKHQVLSVHQLMKTTHGGHLHPVQGCRD
jgi:hypothetical protein